MSVPIRVLLFDVGGVLVELSGVSSFQQLLQQEIGEEEVWRRWLQSPAVRAFESGRCDQHQFAAALIEEFAIVGWTVPLQIIMPPHPARREREPRVVQT